MSAQKGNAHWQVGEGVLPQQFHSESYINQHDCAQDFQDAIRAAGLEPPREIFADGALHRFSSNGKRGDEAGWYVLHGDGVPAGVFGNWRTGFTQTWRADIGRKLTTGEELANYARWEAMRLQRERERIAQHQEAQAKAERIWRAATPAPADHPYLVRKGIQSHGVRLTNGALVVPVRGAEAGLSSLQFITSDGGKRFLSGGIVKGGHYFIGTPGKTLCIAEGFATGATIHEATGYPAAVAFNAGNLLPVAQAMRQKFPDVKIIICADDDNLTAGNPGLTKGKEAAREIGALLFVPMFRRDRPAAATDFNDLAQLCGVEAVMEQISWI